MHIDDARLRSRFAVTTDWPKALFLPSRTATTALLALLLVTLNVTGCGGAYPNPEQNQNQNHPLLAVRVTANPSPAVDVASTILLSADGAYGGGPHGDITYKDVTSSATWSTSDASIATVSNGLITGTGIGSVTISAAFGGKSGSMTVFVGLAHYITISPPGPFSLSATPETDFYATETFSDGSTVDVSVNAFWTATPGGVFDIYPYLEGHAKLLAPGTATVTATLDSGESGSVEVTVVP